MTIHDYSIFEGVRETEEAQPCPGCRKPKAVKVSCWDGTEAVECRCRYKEIDGHRVGVEEASNRILMHFIGGVLFCSGLFALIAYFLGWYS